MNSTIDNPAVTVTYAETGAEIIRYQWDYLISRAFDLLVDSPRGITLDELVEHLEVPEHVTRQTINKVRELLSEDGDCNIIAVPDGRERRYQLVNEAGEQVEAWAIFNRKYVESRLKTVEQVYSVLVRAAKNERERDDARRMLKTVQRLIEDTQEMQINHEQGTLI